MNRIRESDSSRFSNSAFLLYTVCSQSWQAKSSYSLSLRPRQSDLEILKCAQLPLAYPGNTIHDTSRMVESKMSDTANNQSRGDESRMSDTSQRQSLGGESQKPHTSQKQLLRGASQVPETSNKQSIENPKNENPQQIAAVRLPSLVFPENRICDTSLVAENNMSEMVNNQSRVGDESRVPVTSQRRALGGESQKSHTSQKQLLRNVSQIPETSHKPQNPRLFICKF